MSGSATASGLGRPTRRMRHAGEFAGGPSQVAGAVAIGAATAAAAAVLAPVAAAAFGWTVPLLVGGVAGAAATFAGWCERGRLRRRWFEPLQQSVATIEAMGAGSGPTLLPLVGPPLLQSLARAVNQLHEAIDRRERLSQANLMSVEAAFDRIHALLQSLTEGIVLIDAHANVLLANSSARRLLHDDGRPFEGSALLSRLPAELQQPVRRALEQLQSGSRDEVQVRGLPVGARFLDLSVVQVRSTRSDHVFGTVVALGDVTRNYEIAKLKEEFIASISHELRTPLTNICAFTEILGQVTPDSGSEWREFVGILATESTRLRGLVEDILWHGRLRTGDVTWTMQAVDMRELSAAVVDDYRALAAPRRLALECCAGAGDLRAHCDRAAMAEVLRRLIDNAVKFTPDGGHVRVSVESLDEAVEVSVEDSGLGVPADAREAIFEGFRQIGDHMTEKPRGAGLGLPICRSIVDRMGGAILCEESELGGARLRFFVPTRPMASIESVVTQAPGPAAIPPALTPADPGHAAAGGVLAALLGGDDSTVDAGVWRAVAPHSQRA